MAPLRLYERQQSLATDGMGAHTGSRVSLGKFTSKRRNKDEDSTHSRENQGILS